MSSLPFSPQPKIYRKKKKSAVSVWEQGKKKIVKPDFVRRGINYCEVCKWLHDRGEISDQEVRSCQIHPTFAHRHKRGWYKSKDPHLLFCFNQIIRAGQYHHDKYLEWDKEEKEKWFTRLRGKEQCDCQDKASISSR